MSDDYHSSQINNAGQMMKEAVENLLEYIPNETVKKNFKAHLDELEKIMSESTDPCMAGKIAQNFGPFIDSLKSVSL